jgi:hypothetical protein
MNKFFNGSFFSGGFFSSLTDFFGGSFFSSGFFEEAPVYVTQLFIELRSFTERRRF